MKKLLGFSFLFIFFILAFLFVSPNNSVLLNKNINGVQITKYTENSSTILLSKEIPSAYLVVPRNTETTISNNNGKNKNIGFSLSCNSILNNIFISNFIFCRKNFSYKNIFNNISSFLEYVIITRAP